MELAIVLILVFIAWTNETLFPKEEKKKTVDEKLAEAIKDYLKEGFKIRKDP
ncbi:hypothetical protein IQ273_01175 [Nodosilinea sp. LEGE 07298]|uniref:hypothetical protein n=1 Tax=Nodosilinea sp. LEGE 07298 TaxID=2777970 RepID=UPI00187E73CF|nr:hypothetical protein [Nodosilinea sp. LEGE 07298]MBE9108037.1 hypothetical protein [Nodosilinea sp. LEGE 07298]